MTDIFSSFLRMKIEIGYSVFVPSHLRARGDDGDLKITLFTKQELLLADTLKPWSRYKSLVTNKIPIIS